MPKDVAILGLGPTGVFAARAARDAGARVTIYALPSAFVHTPPGSFWLHWLPDELAQRYPKSPILISSIGTEDVYFAKQWGVPLTKGRSSSFPVLGDEMTGGYDPKVFLPMLLPDDCDKIPLLKPLDTPSITSISQEHDLVFCTFALQEHLAIQPPLRAYAALVIGNTMSPGRNVVVYDGNPLSMVVRTAVLFGYYYIEFPKTKTQVELDALEVMKDLKPTARMAVLRDLDLDTKPIEQDPRAKLQLIGRFAEWNRKRLSHETYQQVYEKVLA